MEEEGADAKRMMRDPARRRAEVLRIKVAIEAAGCEGSTFDPVEVRE